MSISGGYQSKSLLNNTNFASYFRSYLGFLYDSHGCLHFTPSDIYLLYKTVPKGTPLIIKPYSDKDPGFQDSGIAFFDDAVMNEKDVEYYASVFSYFRTAVVVYPSLSRLYIYVDGKPFVKVLTHAGPPYYFAMLEDVVKGGPLGRDFMTATPTDPGRYSILGKTDFYRSPTYPQMTAMPFGAYLKNDRGAWYYKKNGRFFRAPAFIQEDLGRNDEDREYNYYDIEINNKGDIVSARWGGHDFGKYVVTWTGDGRSKYPEIGYCSGQLLFEQHNLVSQIADILTMPGTDDLDELVRKNAAFSSYNDAFDFVSSSGASGHLIPEEAAFYRLFHGIPLTSQDRKTLDPRLADAYRIFKSGNLPKDRQKRQDVLSLYNYLRVYNETIKKNALWYSMLKRDWGIWGNLRRKLTEDFDKSSFPREKRKSAVEDWLNRRLEFKTVR